MVTAPAFGVTYSYNPSGSWTVTHQMTLNGKRDDFTLEVFQVCAKAAVMKRGRAAAIIDEVLAAVKRWPDFAAEAKLPEEWRDKIQATHRLLFQKHELPRIHRRTSPFLEYGEGGTPLCVKKGRSF